jgi:hypothetical protein
MPLSLADVDAGVRAAIAAYTLALDDGRSDDVVATFCSDGAVDIPGLGAHAGHDALRTAYTKVEPRWNQRHLVLNTSITSWDEREARTTSDVVFLLQGESGWDVKLVGRYEDTLHNDDGTWRFHHRKATFVQ